MVKRGWWRIRSEADGLPLPGIVFARERGLPLSAPKLKRAAIANLEPSTVQNLAG